MTAALLVATGCESDPPPQLVVGVKTDLTPGLEFDAWRVTAGDASDAGPVGRAEWHRGHRVLDTLAAAGNTLVRVELELGGSVVLAREVSVRVQNITATTVVLTRDCRGVACPGAGDVAATSCLGGRCVPPECVEGHEEACDDPECSAPMDCPDDPAACVVARCEAGVCFGVADDSGCAFGEQCAPGRGCEPRILPGDAGPDAPLDAGPPDAGTDAGPDVCATALFCDGFEEDVLTSWDGASMDLGGTLERTSDDARSGSFSLRAASGGATGRAMVLARPAGVGPELWVRFYLKAPSHAEVEQVRFAALQVGDANAASFEGTWQPARDNWSSGAQVGRMGRFGGSAPIVPDVWTCVEFELIEGDPGTIGVYIDGEESIRDGDWMLSTGYDTIAIGVAGADITALYDDVVIATTRPGCD